MTKTQIKAEIAIIKKCEKSIYDYNRRYHMFSWAEDVLYRKRKRLERKLKGK